ncbi:MAG TPA: hypothetical protein VMZ28_12205 [Kofleriaceae bacterium]|nr:hypothetical protein [Kofleriaceae bacterium]
MRAALAVGLASAMATAGCYRASVRTAAPGVGETYEDKQWFALFGMVRMSDPAGDECGEAGTSHTEVRVGWSDFFVSSALTTLGGTIAFWACNEDNYADRADYATCLFASTTLPPALLSSRTVEYRCGPDRSPVQ